MWLGGSAIFFFLSGLLGLGRTPAFARVPTEAARENPPSHKTQDDIPSTNIWLDITCDIVSFTGDRADSIDGNVDSTDDSTDSTGDSTDSSSSMDVGE